MTLQLDKYTIELKEKITYGEKEDIAFVIEDETNNKKNIKDFRSKLLSTYIVSIKEGEKEVVFSEEWLRSLDADDGTELVEYISGLFNPKKKES